MTRILLLSVIVIMVAGEVNAQTGGTVGIFSDQEGMQCNIFDNGPTTFSVYVVHIHWNGVSGIRFTAAVPECATGVSWQSDVPSFAATTGNSQTGVTVSYGSGCVYSLLTTVLRINLLGSGTTPDCCVFQAEPFPGDPVIEVVDCRQNLLEAYPNVSTINGNFFNCDCEAWIPVRSQSWGAIKAIYK